MIKREDCLYTSCYCEENIYKFIRKHCEQFDEVYAVFITNPRQQCVIWCQKLSDAPAVTPVCWDYHVVAVARKSSEHYVFDFDTTLSFPCPLDLYAKECFKPSNPEISQWWLQFAIMTGHYFRAVKGPDFLKTFSSDRSHMIDESSGNWKSDPPGYEPIYRPDLGHNLMDFLDLENTALPGKWLDFSNFLELFSCSL